MLTAYLWHFGPNTLSSRIAVSVRSNQFPEELVDPQVFQIRSLVVAFGPMWLGALKPGRNDRMPRARNNETWWGQLSGAKAVVGESAKTSTSPDILSNLSRRKQSKAAVSLTCIYIYRNNSPSPGTADDVGHPFVLWTLQVGKEGKEPFTGRWRQPCIQRSPA